MAKLIKNIASLVTCKSEGKLMKSGDEMQDVGEIKNAAMIFDDKILWVGESKDVELVLQEGHFVIDSIIDANSKTILPGFVDSHTHIVFAGNRSNEFGRRLRGASYQEIAQEGGGILTTMKATRNASIEELASQGIKLAISAMKYGTTAIEIKSGYGLTLESELNQLRAIKKLKEELPLHISTTFLGAHDFPPEYKDNQSKYIDIICNEMLPKVAEEKLAEYCDAFVDKGYYTIEQGERIIQSALDLGFKIKMHADELACVGAAELAAKYNAISADHLLFVSDEGIESMKRSGTIATLLPGTAYFIRMKYAPARKIIDAGVPVAISTDCNPGSSFTENMQLILSLSAINMFMTAEEALNAATINGAAAIEQSGHLGSLEVGKQADFCIADVESYIDLFYHFGINHIEETWVKGEKVCY